MATNKNDTRILTLKKQIQDKKDKLGATSRFTPVTNMSLELNGNRYNLNVLTKEQLMQRAVEVHAYSMSAVALGFIDDYFISGFRPAEWLLDITARIAILSKKDEEKLLAEMEAKLSKMLSDEKQVELELDEIAHLLMDKI